MKNLKKAKKNGAYTRLFNDALIGLLFSQIHATTISNRIAIEKLFYEQLENNKRIIYKFKNFEDFYLMSKDKIYFLLVKELEKNKNAILYLIKLKIGETFDTKKLKGETDVLNICQTHFKNKLKNNFKIVQLFVCYD